MEGGVTKARDIMNSSLEIVSVYDTVADAVRRMAEKDIGAGPDLRLRSRLQAMVMDRFGELFEAISFVS
jgi:predicted transcriptional regulator